MELTNLSSLEIQKYFKNRYPLLMIDFVERCIPGKLVLGYKNFSNNEWFFPKHFETNPNVPGSILLEAMMDMFIMGIVTLPGLADMETADYKIDALCFKKQVKPGQRMVINCEIDSFKRGVAKGSTICYVDNSLVCSCNLIICVPEILNKFNPVNT